jgi:hypothetical protein
MWWLDNPRKVDPQYVRKDSTGAGCEVLVPGVAASLVRVEPVPGQDGLFCVRLSTSHHAFSLTNSCTYRDLSSFYYLQHTLEDQQARSEEVASLPLRPVLWLRSAPSRAAVLATFLSSLIADWELLSNRALHLFLQTQLPVDMIKANLDGQRDDQVISLSAVGLLPTDSCPVIAKLCDSLGLDDSLAPERRRRRSFLTEADQVERTRSTSVPGHR